jgi:hypothetical protein
MSEKRKLTPSEKDLIRREIERFVPKYLATVCNAQRYVIQCDYAFPESNKEILVYKDKIIKIFCRYLNETKCTIQSDKIRPCYILKD